MKKIKVYIAGKVSKNSSFKTSFWRDEVCRRLEELTGFSLINLDPTKSDDTYPLDENRAEVVFGRDCFLIQSADVVITYLSDDISVGGSQEMLIAKYFKKPLIGLANKDGKFCGDKEIYGRLYKNWIHPFVKMSSDYLAYDLDEVALYLFELFSESARVKNLSVIEESIEKYKNVYLSFEPHLPAIGLPVVDFLAYKGLVIDPKKERVLVVRYADRPDVSEKVRGKLGMAGGKIFDRQRPDKDFSRRVKEETGILAETKMMFGAWSWRYERHNQVNQIFALANLALYQGGEISAPYKHNEFDLKGAEWLNLKNIKIDEFISDEQPLVSNFLRYSEDNPFVFT